MKLKTKSNKKNSFLELSHLDVVKNWNLHFESCDFCISWDHTNNLSSVEIQKNSERMWESEYFKCDSRGFIREDEILFISSDKQEVIDFSIGWMNHHNDGEWNNGGPYSTFDLRSIENWILDEEYSCENFISWNHVNNLLRFDIKRNEEEFWMLTVIRYNKKGDLVSQHPAMLSYIKESTIGVAVDWMIQTKDGKYR